ncbi:MAG: extracellular solute-binding protein [Lachnospiraceae bacterium]|nr:extracellular solute-binding protein [Lachnospiraceae bacterium]
MKKKLLAVLMATALMATALTGCGDKNEGGGAGGNNGGDSAGDPVEALIASTDGTVNLSVWAAEEDQDMVKNWCDSFAAQYPEVTFNFSVGVQSESTAKDTVLTDPEAAADVYSFAGDQLQDLVRAGALQAVVIHTDEVIARVGGADSGAAQAATVNGTLYAYPATADNGYFMFYNKEYFTEEDVKTLDAMMKIAADNGKQITMQYDSGWYNLSFFIGAGFELTLNEDGTNNCNWNGTSADGIAGVDVAQAMLDIATNPGFVSLTDAEFVTGIKEGSIIAGVNGTWNATAAAEAWGDNYAATCLPTYTCAGKQIQMASVAGYKMFGVNAYTANPGWAMLLAEYFTDEAQQIERFELREAGPANVAAASSAAVQANPAIAALALQSQYAILDGCESSNYWSPTESFGAILAGGNADGTSLQTLLDNLVDGITQ